uniref:Uncharacterized protein n=1 Tax=Anguilla anguilla TaxID=7936 RepID=A0A0E9QUI8_ANGAN
MVPSVKISCYAHKILSWGTKSVACADKMLSCGTTSVMCMYMISCGNICVLCTHDLYLWTLINFNY